MPLSSYSKTSPAQVGRSKSDVSLMRDKNDCITCRIRRKKCSGVEPGQTACGDCLRINVQCLGVQHQRPKWLRKPEALKETKFRIKHFLTEYPLPRSRSPAPERPHLNFDDLIEKYTPRVPSLDECKHLTIESIWHDSPPHSPFLGVRSAHCVPGAPSPSSSYVAMPRTPTSAEDSLFTPDIPARNYPEWVLTQDFFMPQPVGADYPETYGQYDAYNSDMVPTTPGASPVSPYYHDYSQTALLTTPVAPFHYYPYLTDHLPSPTPRPFMRDADRMTSINPRNGSSGSTTSNVEQRPYVNDRVPLEDVQIPLVPLDNEAPEGTRASKGRKKRKSHWPDRGANRRARQETVKVQQQVVPPDNGKHDSAPSSAQKTQIRHKVRSREISSEEMFQCLVDNSCVDLTLDMDPDQYSTGLIVGGGTGDVWKGKLRDGTEVAIKVWRFCSITDNEARKATKRAMREVYHWSKVKHKNIQELMGVIMFQGRLGMVSLWMEHGNLREYISKHPSVDRYSLCVQVTTGVSYLHSCEMIHGDIKAANILMSGEGVPKLSDFDHSILSECTLIFSETTNFGGGTLRWMAPELLLSSEEEGSPPTRRNKQTDVYALGMTLLEIVANQIPYAEYKQDHGVYRALDKKRPPARPTVLLGPAQREELMWALLMRCWDHDPPVRPSSGQVLEALEHLVRIKE